MQLWGDAVVLYASKLFSQGETRDHFRNDPCKYVTIAGWHILVDVNTLARDFTFQLTDPIRRNVYQFRTGKYVCKTVPQNYRISSHISKKNQKLNHADLRLHFVLEKKLFKSFLVG